MNEEKRKILEMLAEGKIKVDEAERLLAALSEDSEPGSKEGRKSSKPKYLRIVVEPAANNKNGDRVNIRVPINLIRAGLKWASFIPKHMQHKVDKALSDKGIDMSFNKMKPEDLDELIINLSDLKIDVEGDEVVKIFCE